MSGKIPVLDNWGNKVGEFTPNGDDGCLTLVAVAAMLFILLLPIAEAVGPPILLMWSLKRHPRSKFWVTYARIVFVLWVVGIVVLAVCAITKQ
jgi:hypothetical protein